MKKYFQELEQLLKMEQQEDIRQYKELFEKRNAAERRAEGVTWYPVAIRNTEVQRADYLVVELERTTHQDIPSRFKSGSPVQFFSNHNAEEDRVDGTVIYQFRDRIRILLKQDTLPEWSNQGKLGLDLGFDNLTYKEMFKALSQASDHPMVDVLTGANPVLIPYQHTEIEAKTLNQSQQKAVGLMASESPLAIILGPPGTGKTTTLVHGILELLKQGEKKILLTAPSNMAVDLLTEKLDAEGVNVVRVGNPVRVSEYLEKLTLDYKIAFHPDSKNIKRDRIRANEFRNMAHKYKRNFGPSERAQRKALFDEAYRILDDIKKQEQYILESVLEEAQVITCTLVGSSFQVLNKIDFDVTIIDEAGQALEPASWIPVLQSEKLVLAGDPFQLPPTIHSHEAARSGLDKTLIEKLLITQAEAVVMLDTQYRMNEKIAAYSSKKFYDGKLKADASVRDQVISAGLGPFLFVDTAGCGFTEKAEGTSISNAEEASFLSKLAQLKLENFKNLTVGVISPYREQLKYLESCFINTSLTKDNQVDINTIDSFQGQERDVILISLTRSNQDMEIGFLSDIRRMNVAMTRARKLLIIAGDSSTLANSSFYEGILTSAQENDAYQSAWEYPSIL